MTSSVALHPGRLTWNLQITHLERKMIFQASMIIFHVNLPGCIFNVVSVAVAVVAFEPVKHIVMHFKDV